MPDRETLRYPFQLLALYAGIYMINAAFMPYMPLYLKSIGFDGSTTGLLLSIGPVLAILSQPVWGYLSDRSGSKTRVLRLMLVGVALVSLLYPVSQQLWYLMGLMILYAFFQSSLAPISDTVGLEYLEGKPWQFGPIRMAGSIGYALMTIIAGALSQWRLTIIFPLCSLAALLAIVSTFWIPTIRGHQKGGKRIMPWVLLRNKAVMGLILFSFTIQITAGFFYSFFSIHLNELGSDNRIVGVAMMIAALSELPFLIFADRLINRLGIRLLLVLSALAIAIRFLLYALISSLTLTLLVTLLHGFAYIIFLFSLAVYISKQVPDELKASGQTLHAVIGTGLSRFVGSTAGGWLSDQVGIPKTFLIFSLLSFAATAWFIIRSLRQKNQPA